MSQLLIGHVSADTANVWVRGDSKSGKATLRHRKRGTGAWASASAVLEAHRGFIHVFPLGGLAPSTAYECEVSFQKGKQAPVREGGFTTAPAGSAPFAFLLGSCNWTKVPLNLLDPHAAWETIGKLVAGGKPPFDAHEKPAFMVHCGDQIYADLPGVRYPDLPYYRREYQNAWKRRPTAEVLASLPHYMILDDHEIFDNFANDSLYLGESSQQIRDVALAAYREYQHSHNPQPYPAPALYYSFERSGAAFFVMDVRSERYKKANPQIISEQQMAAFKRWLGDHAAKPKFVVSSIPFVAEVRGEADDKWCGEPFRAQREEIIDYVAANRIERTVFLTGDMHCSYHATMGVIPAAGGAPVSIHELMSSPINQFTTGLHAFVEKLARTTTTGTRYETVMALQEFYGAHSSVMLVHCDPAAKKVRWEVFRTKTPPPPVLVGSFGA